MATKQDLPGYNGSTAFDGALRFFESEDDSWKSIWGHCYGSLMPDIRIFASDAFGTVFGLVEKNKVAIFWCETGELEFLGIELEDFYEMIVQDPTGTINFDLYQAAIELYGKPAFEEHFAFKVETALGGELTTDNIVVMDAIEHFRAMAKIANQIKNIPTGQRIEKIKLEEK